VSSDDSRAQGDNQHSGQRSEEALELLPGYALGALEPDEHALVEAELASNPEFRREFRHYQTLLDDMLLAGPVSDPPDTLRDRILHSAIAPAQAVPVPIRRSRAFRPLAAVAAVIILTLSGTVAILLGEVRERNERIDEMQVAASRSPDFSQPLVWSTIGAEEPGSDRWGYFCRTEDGSVAWIIVDGMYSDENMVYQLWLVDGDRMVNGGMIPTDHEGRGFGVIRVGVPVHTFTEIWITVEPPGGSPRPTTDPDMAVPIV
jgi:anti-sigma-K factor RskA